MSAYNYNFNSSTLDVWNDHVDLIAKYYVDDHLSYDAIAAALTDRGISAKGATVKARLQNWKIKRFNPESENAFLAACLLHARAAGKQISFLRLGEEYPMSKVEAYLQRNQQTQPSADVLPAYFKAVEVLAMPNGTSGEAVSNGHDFAIQNGQTQLPGEDADATRKKRKHAAVATWARPSAHTRASAARSKEYGDSSPGAEKDDKAEAPANAESSKAKLDNIQKAIATINALSRDLGLKDADITEALHQPEKLHTLAKEREAQTQEEDKQTDLGPLHFAAYRDDVVVINALLHHNADVNARGGSGITALHIAAARDNFEAVQALLLSDDLDLDAVDGDGTTALSRAINGESLQCALLLVHQGADVDMANPNGQTPLHYVCLEKNMKPLLEQILMRSKEINRQDKEGQTALHYAIFAKNWEYVEMLIKNGKSDLNIQDRNGRTPLHTACFHAPPYILTMMLESKDADCTITGNELETILHLVCQRDICDVAEAVLRKPGVNVNAKRIDGTTPLILAAYNGSYDTVNVLIDNGANVSDHDADLDTALTTAIRAGYTKVAGLLIEKGSPVNPQNKSPRRYRAELQSARKAQEVSSALNSMDKRSKTPFVESYARPRGGSSHAEPGRQPALRFTGMSGLSPAQLQTMFEQLVDQGLVKLSGSSAGTGGAPGAGAGNITMGLMQTGFDPSSYPRAAETNMYMWSNPTDMTGLGDAVQASNFFGGVYGTDGMEL